MKNYFVIILLACALTACKKATQSVQEDLVVKAMTDGQWRVTKFISGSTDITTDFSLYKFQFKTNNTVDAIKSSSVENSGSWDGDAVARTITSSFTNATQTVMLLNGIWQITNNGWTFVEATQSVNNEILTLRLDK
jgi:hypothetical protein